jgi:hypothetical protein
MSYPARPSRAKEAVMKKLYALGLLVAPLFLAAAWMGTRTLEEAQQQEIVSLPAYGLESGHIAMQDVGALLERLGREIQQDESVTFGGNSYPLSGFGGVEFSVNRMRRGDLERTGVQLDIGSEGRSTTPVNFRTGELRPGYDPYQRSGRNWESSALADVLAELGQTLASTGAIVLEHHQVPFRGAANIDQRLLDGTRGGIGRGRQYELEVHVLFGEGVFEGPDDDEDYVEDQEYGLITSLARSQQEDADQAAVAQMFSSLAEDLRAGRMRVGDEEVPVGETPVAFVLTHVTATDGAYDKIEFSLHFGPTPEWPSGAQVGDESFNEPMTDLAAIMQRIGAQILEDGTFEFNGETFTVSSTANWEIGVGPRGFAIEVSYRHPPER